MTNSTIVPEQIEFLRKVFHLTRKNEIDWDTTADLRTLVAPLAGEYSVRLQQIDDLEGQSEISDHQLTLMKKGRALFSLDRSDVSDLSTFEQYFAGQQLYSYTVFKELWDRAYLKANKISDEVEKVNKLLDSLLRDDPPF